MRCKTSALLEINHALEQQSYVDWKYQVFKDMVLTGPKARAGNGSRQAYRFTTRSLPELTVYYRRFYREGRKEVPEDLALTPLSAAVWFMDDGNKSHKALYLNTQQFTVPEQQGLMDLLEKQWGVKSALNRDKQYYRIRIAVGSVPRFAEIVRPHILPGLMYKFPG